VTASGDAVDDRREADGHVRRDRGAFAHGPGCYVVTAALSGDRKAALHAFLLDPTTQSHLDLDQTQALLDEMLEANSRYLPLFER
jgi:hypothetical protein